jgi:hypothetical protein
MSFDRVVFAHQYVVVQDFVRHAAYATAIHKRLDGRKRTSNFWPQTYNAHYKAAALDWCKVFGSDGPNPTHWKKTPTKDVGRLQDDFRQTIFRQVRTDAAGWKRYWEQMINFRGQYLGHLEIGKSAPPPNLQRALKIAFAYDDWIRRLIHPDLIFEAPLKDMYRNWLGDGLRIVMSADGIERI